MHTVFKRPLGKRRCDWEDYMKRDLKGRLEKCGLDVLAQNRDQ